MDYSAPPYFNFYSQIIDTLLRRKAVTTSMSVLAVCAGETDKRIFQSHGFEDVTISNLDSRIAGDEFKPYKWSYQDAEGLTFPDNSFELVVACAGLHHCRSPHRGLLEMYRVARRCAVVLEARDGFLSRIAVRLGVADEYEVTAVAGNNFAYGGVANTAVPNYIYRWTEREVEKAIASFAPHVRPKLIFLYKFAPPLANLRTRKTLRGLLVMCLAWAPLWVITKLFPRQGNLIGFAIVKPELPGDLFPWVMLEAGQPTINREWVGQHYKEPLR